MNSRYLIATLTVLSNCLFAVALKGEELYVAQPLTAEKEFTKSIEGPACNKEGTIFAVNYGERQTIGRVTPDGQAEIYLRLTGKRIGNGIRFDQAGIMYVADYGEHNILCVDPVSRAVSVFAHEAMMHQPNDIAISARGTLYASDPDWGKKVGQVWFINKHGQVRLAAGEMGTTNGLDLSPDDKILYVNETVQRKIWAFTVTDDGLTDKRLFFEFPDFAMDGMRCDVQGNIYVTRYGKGVVAVLSPQGDLIREINVLGKNPSNICFGGPDGCTAYVTEVEHQRLVSFRVDFPGKEWAQLQR